MSSKGIINFKKK